MALTPFPVGSQQGLLQALAQLGQSNALVAQREQAARDRKAQKQQALLTLLGTVGGGVVGGPAGAFLGAGAASLVGPRPNITAAAQMGFSGFQGLQAGEGRDAIGKFNELQIDRSLSDLKMAQRGFPVGEFPNDPVQFTPDQRRVNEDIKALEAFRSEDLSRLDPRLVAAFTTGRKPSTPFTLGPGQKRFTAQGKVTASVPARDATSNLPRVGAIIDEPLGNGLFQRMKFDGEKFVDLGKPFRTRAEPKPVTEVTGSDAAGRKLISKKTGETIKTIHGPVPGAGKGKGGGLKEFESVILPKVRTEAMNFVRRANGLTDILDLSISKGVSMEELKKIGEVNPVQVQKEYLNRLEGLTRSTTLPKASRDVARKEADRVRKQIEEAEKTPDLGEETPHQPNTPEEFAALPSGARYIDPNDPEKKVRVKP